MVKVLGNVKSNVQTHVIREFQRTHRVVVSQFHCRINVFRRSHALLEHTHGFESKGYAETAGSKARHIANDYWLLSQPAADSANNFNRIIAGRFPNDNFNQAHDVDWVEEVHAYHLGRSLGSFGDFSNRK